MVDGLKLFDILVILSETALLLIYAEVMLGQHSGCWRPAILMGFFAVVVGLQHSFQLAPAPGVVETATFLLVDTGAIALLYRNDVVPTQLQEMKRNPRGLFADSLCGLLQPIALVVSFYLVMALLDMLMLLVLGTTTDYAAEQVVTNDAYWVIGTVTARMLMLMLIKFAVRKIRRRLQHVTTRQLLLSNLPPLFSLGVLAFVLYDNVPLIGNQINLVVLIYFTLLWLNLFNLLYLLEKDLSNLQQAKLWSVEQSRTVETGYRKALQRSMEKLRILAHDLRHIGYATRQPETVEAWVGQNYPVYTGNGTVDALLWHWHNEMEQAGVQLVVTGVLPAELPFDEYDLHRLLGNALENAWEACMQIETITEKTIFFAVDCDDFALHLLVRNPLAVHKTNQKGPGRYGLGIKSMREIVERHGGHLQISQQNSIFILELFLQLHYKQV